MSINVLYIHGIGELGGAEKDLCSYLDLLDRNDFRPHVVCPEKGVFIDEVRKKQVSVAGIGIPPWRKLKGIMRLPFAILKLARVYRQWKIDLVHVNDYWWFPQAYLAAVIYRVPIAVHLRQQIEPKRVKQYWLEKPDFLFPVSKDIEGVLLKAGVRPDRVSVTYSGIDTNHFFNLRDKKRFYDRYDLQDDQAIIGTVANLFPRKGYEYLIEALVEVKKFFPNIRCFVVGEGPESYRKQLITLVGENNLSANIKFVGFQKDVYEFLNIFDVFVLPSLMEGFGIALLEAMAMSKPIVASSVGGVPEVIADGKTGILVPPRNSKALANAILKMLRDDRMREGLGLAARKVIQNKFTQDIAMKTIQGFYFALIEETRCFRK